MSHDFVRIPPDSTGKKILTGQRTIVHYDNNVGGTFAIGQTVTGLVTGATGTITGIVTSGFAANEGLLWLDGSDDSWQDNEAIQVSAVTFADVNAAGTGEPAAEVHLHGNVIKDLDNPDFSANVDRFGAIRTTFADGSANFGSFGTISVGEPQIIKGYEFQVNSANNEFYTELSGAGALLHENTQSRIVLQTGTASGDLAKRTTHYYHPYTPGAGNFMFMTAIIGDTGKTNVRRRWGLFDDNNGLFFQLDGTTLSVVVRTTTTDGSSITETVVDQADWNQDKLDGSDDIGFTLDVSKGNIYWIDYQWLGSGRVRFGVYEPDGSKLVAHVFEHANQTTTYPYMLSGALPVGMEQENTGTAGSTSETRIASVSVGHQSKVIPVGVKHSANSMFMKLTPGGGEVPMMAVQSANTDLNGRTNRSIIKGIATSLINSANTGNGPILWRVYSGAVSSALTGGNFFRVGDISEVDIEATAANTSILTLSTSMVSAPDTSEIIQEVAPRELNTFEAFLHADGLTKLGFLVTAELLAGTDADGMVTINWEEIY